MDTHNRSSTWNANGGYRNGPEPYPFHVIDAGLQYSLIVVLKVNSYDMDYLCGDAIQGFKIGFHSPFDLPLVRRNFFDLSPKRAVYYSIEPKIIETAVEMQKFGPQERQCYFDGEHRLRFYPN